MPKKIFIFLILIFLIAFGFLIFNFRRTEKIEAGAADNVSGWAWLENIGWISFNNTTGGGPIDYGVNIDPATGNFSGYAWSRGTTPNVGGIGWVKFDPAGPYPAAPNYSACINFPGVTGEVCEGDLGENEVGGWVRAYRAIASEGQTLGGWDGWIKLRGWTTEAVPTEYGVSLNPATNEFEGWAWGGDPQGDLEAVVGWISFNCLNQGVCGTSDYKVMTSLNFPPYVESGSPAIAGESYCLTSPTGQISIQWTYQDDDGDNQSQYQLQVATDSGFANKVIDCIIDQGVSPGGTGTSAVTVVPSPSNVCNDGGLLGSRSLEINYRGPGNFYYWRVRVKAATGNLNWSEWEEGPNFDTPAHAKPRCDFTWSPQSPSVDEIVLFADQSTVYGGATKSAWNWVFPADWEFEAGYDASSQNPAGKFTISGGKTVSLTMTDSDGLTCTDSKSLNVTFPLPEWREVPPF